MAIGRFFGTVTLGYDHQFSSRWVAGAFVDYDFGNRTTIPDQLDWALYRRPPVERKRSRVVDRWQARRPIEPEHAFVRVSRLDSSFGRSRPFCHGWYTQFSRSFDKDRDGWFVGAGIETQLGWLGSNWSLRGEYRFSQFDDDNRRLTLAEGPCG